MRIVFPAAHLAVAVACLGLASCGESATCGGDDTKGVLQKLFVQQLQKIGYDQVYDLSAMKLDFKSVITRAKSDMKVECFAQVNVAFQLSEWAKKQIASGNATKVPPKELTFDSEYANELSDDKKNIYVTLTSFDLSNSPSQ